MFGCSEGGRSLWHLRDEVMERALDEDRLTRQDGVDRDRLGLFLETRRLTRRDVLRTGGALAAAAVAAPAFADIASASPVQSAAIGQATARPGGAEHVIPSVAETVRLGQIDSTLPPIDTIDSGDTLVYPNTMSHFLNRIQPGVPIEEIAQLRRDNPGRGPHTIIGPVAMRNAERGDLLACRFDRLLPVNWGVNFNNPGELRTGALPDEFPQGQVKYFNLDLASMTTEFAADFRRGPSPAQVPGGQSGPGAVSGTIRLPLAPFQGTFGVAPPEGGVVSSVPPGQHAGNLDLRDLNEGSTLYIPVWQPGALIYTGDTHVLQGDGEVNLTAIESAMQEVRVTVTLHKNVGYQWPLAETDSHWYILGIHQDLTEAFTMALRNTLDFLEMRAGMTRLDAYGLASVVVSFRITQVVDINKGVHAMIPKDIFTGELRNAITVA